MSGICRGVGGRCQVDCVGDKSDSQYERGNDERETSDHYGSSKGSCKLHYARIIQSEAEKAKSAVRMKRPEGSSPSGLRVQSKGCNLGGRVVAERSDDGAYAARGIKLK